MVRTIPVRVGNLELAVEAVPVAGPELSSLASKVADGAIDVFDQARAAIVEIAVSMAEVVDATAARGARPDRFEVEFGITISASGNVVVAGAAASATFKVKVAYDAKNPAETS